MILAAAVAAVSSCNKKAEFAPLASSVTVNNADVTLAAVSGTAKVTVTSNGDWISVAPEWASVSPKSGNAGSTEVTITAKDNVNEWSEQMGPRKDVLYFFGNGDEGMAQVNLNQSGEPGLNSERSYSKISKLEDLDVTKAFILVAKVGDKLQAASAVPGTPGDGRYYYWNALAEVTEADGVIVRPNSKQAFKFVQVEEGKYAIQEPGGGYLYQSKGYSTSFYIAASATETADKWTVAFNEAGNVVLTNTTVDPENPVVMQYLNGSYTEFATYKDYPATDCVVLDLYQDSAAATDEILKAEDVTVVASATSATIAVTSNKTWSVRNHDEWIKSFAKNEAGDAVEITFDANTSKEVARTAEFTIIGQGTNVVVTLTQNKIATTIAEITSCITSTSSSAPSPYEAQLEGATVTYVNGGSVYIEDKSGAILLYMKNSGLTAGDVISGTVAGSGYKYNGLPEITALGTEYTKTSGEAPKPTEMTVADVLKNFNANLSRYIVVKGVTVTDALNGNSDRNGEISQGDSKIALRDQSKSVVIAKNSIGDLICFPCLNNSTKQLSVWETAHFTKTGEVTVEFVVDGKFDEWADVPANQGAGDRVTEWKVASDAKNIYFYAVVPKSIAKTRGVWNAYLVAAVDTDNDASTGDDASYGLGAGWNARAIAYPFTNGAGEDAALATEANSSSKFEYPIGTKLDVVATAGAFSGDNALIEFSMPREKMGSPAAGATVRVGFGMGSQPAGTTTLVLK